MKIPSLNDWYTGAHYGVRMTLKRKVRAYFLSVLQGITVKVTRFKVVYLFNNRLDTDNNLPAVKMFVDTMKDLGIIIDDSHNYFVELVMRYEPALKNGTGLFEVWRLPPAEESGSFDLNTLPPLPVPAHLKKEGKKFKTIKNLIKTADKKTKLGKQMRLL